ncbi:hypothetical protein EW093_09075 [Thiospirochaeta perfilievii]|uniref:Uncharacterized protein n=1 Tax=Thiospirochaeta perfilievii TaxID=252967 RepID=A0A5C1QD07_9SPIO|nr:hypothetical protein [Thiospirochaeta perfilievii]QEN04849.1 hypothetical protein EW093_09075 [Thiospirochaeta perfilievii]
MTLKIKNLILGISTTINILITILLIFIFYLNPLIRIPSLYLLLTNSIVSGIITLFIYLYFKKSLPSEIILFVIFLTSFSLQGIRVLDLTINFETYAIIILLGRISIFLKYLGLLSLLGASLFSYSIKKQKVGSWVLLSILTSAVLATMIHFNTGVIENTLLPMIIFRTEEQAITVAIVLITFITLIKSGFDSKNRDYLYLGIATFMLSTCLVLTFISLSIMFGIAIVLLLICGAIMFMTSMHTITLWG